MNKKETSNLKEVRNQNYQDEKMNTSQRQKKNLKQKIYITFAFQESITLIL